MATAAAELDLDDFTWAEWADDPYPLYRRLRDERPVFSDASNDTFVLTRSDDVYEVLSDVKRFSNVSLDIREGRARRFSPLREEDPPRHGFLRSIVKPLLTPGSMRRREAYLRDVARELLDDAERADDGVVEVSSALGARLPERVTLDLLGLPVGDHAHFQELVRERHRFLLEKDGRIVKVERPRTIEHLNADMWTMVRPVIDERRREPREDMISVLAAAQHEHGAQMISDDDILDMLLHLLTGGFATTQHLIELLVSYLADHPGDWERLRADRSLVGAAIEEMLRWESPVQALNRRAAVDTEVRGVRIPLDAELTVVYGSANRDERAFEDPDEFRMDRDTRRHVAFGYGIHYCIGAPLSRYEVVALMNEMLDRYRTIERAGPSEPLPEQRVTVGKMRGFGRVPVRLVRA